MNPQHKALVREFLRGGRRADRAPAPDELAERVRMSPADQRQFGRQLINRRLEHAKQQLEQGRALTFEDETALAQAIHDALFGLGALQRLLDDESIENIDANGCADVWVTHADGTKHRPHPSPTATTS